MISLKKFLNNKPIYYKRIDKFYIFEVFNRLNLKLKNVIQVVGTNGKGSTSRFITQILRANSYEVGHFSSPHLFDMNERFYRNDRILSDDELNEAHEILYSMLTLDERESLSYFEYLTLLCGIVFKDCDYVLLEAGLGCEFDATSIYDKILSLYTPIGFDHMHILGDSIEKIAATKFKKMAKLSIMSDEMSPKAVKIGKDIAKISNSTLKFANEFLDANDKDKIQKFITDNNLASFLKSNLSLAAAGAKSLQIPINLNFKFDLFGRCSKISNNIIVDVGHNEMCAKALSSEVYEIFGDKFTLIYNSFDDKEIEKILLCFKDFINEIEIFNYVSDKRALGVDRIFEFGKRFNIKVSYFNEISKNKNYLVFGSFMLVENFMKGQNWLNRQKLL